MECHTSVAVFQSQYLMLGHTFGREPLADAETYGAIDALENRHGVGFIFDVYPHITMIRCYLGDVHQGIARTATDGDDGALAVVEDLKGCGVGNVVALAGVLGQIEGLEVLLPRIAPGNFQRVVLVLEVVGVEAVGEALGCPDYRLVFGIGNDKRGVFVEDGLDGAALVHGPVVGQVERGAAAGQRLGRLQVEQVGVGIFVENVAVLADVVVVAGSADDEPRSWSARAEWCAGHTCLLPPRRPDRSGRYRNGRRVRRHCRSR